MVGVSGIIKWERIAAQGVADEPPQQFKGVRSRIAMKQPAKLAQPASLLSGIKRRPVFRESEAHVQEIISCFGGFEFAM